MQPPLCKADERAHIIHFAKSNYSLKLIRLGSSYHKSSHHPDSGFCLFRGGDSIITNE